MAASRLMLLLKGAAFARRLGLGPVIDRVRPAVLKRVGRGEAEVRGIVLEAETVEDRMYYGQLQGREGFMADLFERAVEPGSVGADVGANVGFFTLLAARRVAARGRCTRSSPTRGTCGGCGRTSRATASRAWSPWCRRRCRRRTGSSASTCATRATSRASTPTSRTTASRRLRPGRGAAAFSRRGRVAR